MRRLFVILMAVVPLLAGAVLGTGWWRVNANGPLAETRLVMVPKGAGTLEIARIMAESGVVCRTELLAGYVWLTRGNRNIHAGEYEIPAGATIREVAELLLSGKVYHRRVTVPEGLTAWNIVERVKAETALTGETGDVPPEGSLLPDTYFFTYGDSRTAVLGRMREAMTAFLADALAKHPLPKEVPDQNALLTLASIVEKETGKPEERPMVAAVYLNRLRIGMPLQADPTIIYGLTKGVGDQGREITASDLKSDTPYNTYRIAALPPGPIGNPGRASILAVLQPAETKALYFVADGTGGHRFAETLEEHNRNVALYRAWQREQKTD